jgi:GT2 family glycosyltransferase
MSDPKVTILVSPRERFSWSARCLDSIHENTDEPFEMVVVDGGSPPAVQSEIEERGQRYGFELIRSDYVLTPNEARNLGLAKVRTPWVVFIDNDVMVEPGWLTHMLEAGEKNDADLVGPLYLQDVGGVRKSHMAGGTAGFYEHEGRRRFREAHLHHGREPEDLVREIESGPTELLEFHCLMARMSALERHGPLDEQLMTTMEHIDLCLNVREAGGLVWLCMESRVTYLVPPPFDAEDLPFFVLRWSREWTEQTLRHIVEKWQLDPNDPYVDHSLRWAEHHREIALREAMWPLGRIAGRMKYHGLRTLGDRLAHWVESRTVAREIRRRHAALAGR